MVLFMALLEILAWTESFEEFQTKKLSKKVEKSNESDA